MVKFTNRNLYENPWYILATLFGEQDGSSIDPELHDRNRKAWNAWALHQSSQSEKEYLIQNYRVFKGEVADWSDFESIFFERMKKISKGKYIRLSQDSYYHIKDETPAPNPNALIDFSSTEFAKMFCIDGFYIPCDIKFNGCVFQNKIESGWAIFSQSAAFNNVIFNDMIDFSDAKFVKGAYLNGVQCRSEAFWNATSFNGSVSFNGAIFEKRVNFQRVVFQRGVNFTNVKMQDEAWFYGAIFKEGVSFWQSNFLGRLTMIDASFEGGERSRRPDFSDVIFEMPANFRSARFNDCFPIFRGSLLHDKSIFSAEDNLWPKGVVKHLKDAKETCSLLRNLSERQGNIEDAHFFFRSEMKLASRMGSFSERLLYIVYGVFSNFGHSISRPLLGLLSVFVIGLIFFWGGFFVEGLDNPLRTSLALSFNNVFPFFGFGRAYLGLNFFEDLHVVKKIFSALQSILSLPLAFFFGLGLRTRFRMR
ncbi:MAG: pentapeptide repeat-containing protein [Rhodobacteraceae bacterium]|nr:pentapeptide repeat-containing protein [Paracoccaceae bacterium]